jgi:hypothetical protein
MSYISVDVDIDDVLWGMSSYEKQKLADELYEDGYVPKQIKGTLADSDYNYSDFDDQVKKLVGNSWRLSKEDEETILRITNKLI